jgi:NAD(P)-dependent dehydrogenase (short-subunit alcohol dehydrogenase family)
VTRAVRLGRPTGEPLSIEVTTAAGRRRVVLLSGAPRELATRLARAGFAVVAADCRTPDEIGLVLDALKGRALGFDGDEPVAVLAADEALARVSRERGVPTLVWSGAAGAQSVDTAVQWLSRHLV